MGWVEGLDQLSTYTILGVIDNHVNLTLTDFYIAEGRQLIRVSH